MDSPNDRMMLYLLEHKENRTCVDENRIRRLRKLYIGDPFESEIKKVLYEGHYIAIDGPDSQKNEYGQFVPDNINRKIRTTQAGCAYIKSLKRKSESKHGLMFALQLWGVVIAATGGLITIIKAICDWLY